MINNRQNQNGRRRGRGGQRPGGGNPGRPDNGSRIDNRARGNASQLHEKYKSLAADAQRQGDRVNTEYYLQFADHYFRVLSENRPRSDEGQRARRDEEDEFGDGFGSGGDEFGQEGEPVRADQYQPQQAERPRYEDRPRRDDRPQADRQGGDRQQFDRQPDRQRDDRPRQDARSPRDDGYRNDNQRNDGQQNDQSRGYNGRNDGQRTGGQRDAEQRDTGQRDNAQREERRPRRDAQPNGHARLEPAPAPVDVLVLPPDPATEEASTIRSADMDAPAPRRRGRPRRDDAAPVTAEPNGLEADRLPPPLSVSASAEPDTGLNMGPNTGEVAADAEKPRRRRRVAAPVDAPAG